MFIINDFTKQEWEDCKKLDCKYLVMGQEIGELSRRPHIQGYYSLHTTVAHSTIKKKPGFARAKLMTAGGSPWANKVYCEKGPFCTHEAVTARGKMAENYGLQAITFEKGEIPEQGKRKSLQYAIEKVLAGDSLESIANDPATASCFVQFWSGLNRLRSTTMMDRSPANPCFVYWFSGATGMMKSRTAMEFGKVFGPVCIVGGNSDDGKCTWFSNYDGHLVVIIDDLRARTFSFEYLLRLLQNYQHVVNVKNAMPKFCPKFIFITTPHGVEKTFEGKTNEDIKQLKRRLYGEFHFGDRLEDYTFYRAITELCEEFKVDINRVDRIDRDRQGRPAKEQSWPIMEQRELKRQKVAAHQAETERLRRVNSPDQPVGPPVVIPVDDDDQVPALPSRAVEVSNLPDLADLAPRAPSGPVRSPTRFQKPKRITNGPLKFTAESWRANSAVVPSDGQKSNAVAECSSENLPDMMTLEEDEVQPGPTVKRWQDLCTQKPIVPAKLRPEVDPERIRAEKLLMDTIAENNARAMQRHEEQVAKDRLEALMWSDPSPPSKAARPASALPPAANEPAAKRRRIFEHPDDTYKRRQEEEARQRKPQTKLVLKKAAQPASAPGRTRYESMQVVTTPGKPIVLGQKKKKTFARSSLRAEEPSLDDFSFSEIDVESQQILQSIEEHGQQTSHTSSGSASKSQDDEESTVVSDSEDGLSLEEQLSKLSTKPVKAKPAAAKAKPVKAKKASAKKAPVKKASKAKPKVLPKRKRPSCFIDDVCDRVGSSEEEDESEEELASDDSLNDFIADDNDPTAYAEHATSSSSSSEDTVYYEPLTPGKASKLKIASDKAEAAKQAELQKKKEPASRSKSPYQRHVSKVKAQQRKNSQEQLKSPASFNPKKPEASLDVYFKTASTRAK